MMLIDLTLFHLVLDKLVFCSKLFNGTRIWGVNLFLLTKLMIDKIKLCNCMSSFVGVVAVLGTKSKLEKLKYLMTVDLLTKTKSLL